MAMQVERQAESVRVGIQVRTWLLNTWFSIQINSDPAIAKGEHRIYFSRGCTPPPKKKIFWGAPARGVGGGGVLLSV